MVAITVSLVCMGLLIAFPDFWVGIFTSEDDIFVRESSKLALLLFAPSYLFTWFIMTSSAFLTSFDKPKESVFITLSRAIIFPLLSLIIMTSIIGVNGVYITPTISGALTFIIAMVIWKKATKNMRTKNRVSLNDTI